MKKRSIMLGSAVILAVLLVVGGTMAWFTDSKEATNIFNTGTVKIILHDEDGEGKDFTELSNVNPGDTHPKVVYVENDGSENIYVRVRLTPAWSDNLENKVEDVEMAIYPILNDWILLGEWYYYPHQIQKGESTDNIIEQVIFAGAAMNNDYQDATFTLNVEAEAIQVKNDAIKDLWKVDPATWTLIPE